MPDFRAHWTNVTWSSDGCTDGSADSLEEFQSKLAAHFRKNYPDQVMDVWSIEQIDIQHCLTCGEPMGNLGLVYDECVNPACPDFAKGKPQDAKHPF